MAEPIRTTTEPLSVTEADVVENTRKLVRAWAADHVTKLSTDGATIRFRQSRSSAYAINFRIEGRYLLVWGDVGDAIYAWSQPLTWRFLAGCDVHYMAGKLQASPEGRFARGWDEAVALTRLRERFDEPENMGIQQTWQQFLDHWDRPELHDRGAWHEWLRDYGEEFFSDWWDWAPGVGDVVAHTVIVQHEMLQLAIARCEDLGQAAADG